MDKNEKNIQIGAIIKATITAISPYGIFVSYQKYQGLVHISEISDRYVANLAAIFNVNDKITLKVINIVDHKLQLSYKQAIKIDSRILKRMNIIGGFHSLENKLPHWIAQVKGETNGTNTKS